MTVMVGGVERPVTARSVVVGGIERPVTTRSVMVNGVERPIYVADTAAAPVFLGSGFINSNKTIPLPVNAPVGTLLIAAAKSAAGAFTSGFTDTKGNTWTVDGQGGGTKATITIARCRVTTAMTTADTISVSVAPNTLHVMAYSWAANGVDVLGTASGFSNNNSITVSGPIPTRQALIMSAAASGITTTNLNCDKGTPRYDANASRAEAAVEFYPAPAGVAYTDTWSGANSNIAVCHVAYAASV